jgi:hypothetical protein
VNWLAVTIALYGRVGRRAAALMRRNWPVAGVLFVYSAVMSVATVLALGLGIIGGLVVSALWAACVGSFLYLVEMIVRTGRVSGADLRRSAGAYLGDVLGVTFILWLLFTVAVPVLRGLPQGGAILLFVWLGVFVFFNAVPELIYLGHYSSVELLAQSYAFISENWIEWFPATLVLGALMAAVAALPLRGALGYVGLACIALLLTFAMVVRGLLFLELHGSSRRARAFRHRMGA